MQYAVNLRSARTGNLNILGPFSQKKTINLEFRCKNYYITCVVNYNKQLSYKNYILTHPLHIIHVQNKPTELTDNATQVDM